MKDEPKGRSRAGDRCGPDREALRQHVRHPYITRQEPRRRPEDEGGCKEDEAPPPPAS